ncbi:ABC transporter substrate-binding protein [Staphylococcus chromogenes]|nr:ABC transporter substrate-binding protein [Staphylococcus chromogenes]
MNLWKKIAGATAAVGLAMTMAACGGSASDGGQGGKASASIKVTDVMGRTVEFDKQPERIILGEGRNVFATAILDREHPTAKVVAMGNDLKSAAPSYHEKLVAVHPEVKDIPEIGSLAKNDVSVENLLSYQPDVITMTADHYQGAKDTGLLTKLDQAGLKYVVTDFRQHPLQNTTKSMTVLGQILGKQQRAEEFNKEWTNSVERVKTRVAGADKKETFVWRAGGFADCCATVNKSNIGEFVDAAGGKNLGDELINTEMGSITAEKLIQEQPENILVTGGTWAPKDNKKSTHVQLGYSAKPDQAEATKQDLSKLPGMDQVDALKNGHTAAIWHQFYDSPLNFMAVEFIAKWLHPELFNDTDIEAHWRDVHTKYVPFDVSGVFFLK